MGFPELPRVRWGRGLADTGHAPVYCCGRESVPLRFHLDHEESPQQSIMNTAAGDLLFGERVEKTSFAQKIVRQAGGTGGIAQFAGGVMR